MSIAAVEGVAPLENIETAQDQVEVAVGIEVTPQMSDPGRFYLGVADRTPAGGDRDKMPVTLIVVNHRAVIATRFFPGRNDVQAAVVVIVAPGRRSVESVQACIHQLEFSAAQITIDVCDDPRSGKQAAAVNQQVQVAVVVEVAPFHAAAVHIGQVKIQLHEPAAAIISIESGLVQSLPGQSEVQITVIVKIAPGHAPVPHAAKWSR